MQNLAATISCSTLVERLLKNFKYLYPIQSLAVWLFVANERADESFLARL